MRKWMEFFQENNGRLSSARLMAFLATLSFVVWWQVAVWRTGDFNPGWTITAFTLAAVGLKTAQKFAETKSAKREERDNA
jgi:ABC-type transporter Mla subunit MlaD